MQVYFLNVGYGEAIVVQSGDTTIVVDGGSGRDEVYLQPYTVKITRFLDALGVTKIDLLLLTHIHEDHIGGLPDVVEQYEIGEIWCNICPQGDITRMLGRVRERAMLDNSSTLFYRALETYERIRALASERGIVFRAMPGGRQAQLGGLRLETLGMSETQLARMQERFESMFANQEEDGLFELFCENDFICNASSLACRICEGQAAVLLTGDKVGGWDILRRQYELRAQVLKITHHGQKDGMPLDMLEGADPEIVVVCSDQNRTFHSADPALLRRAERFLAGKKRKPYIFITGSLRREGRGGNVLKIDLDPQSNCTKASIKIYE